MIHRIIRFSGGADRRTAIRPEYILSLQTLATDLYWFGDNVHTDIKRKVKAYELGAKARRERGDDKYLDEESPLDNINKGLALELLMSEIMYRLDSPVYSQANCKVIKRRPTYFAIKGRPDICVDYGNRFVVHVEVSASRRLEHHQFSQQLKSALTHMKKAGVNWTLLVTRFARSDRYINDRYNLFVRGNSAAMKRRNIIIMSVKQIAKVSSRLGRLQEFKPGGKPLAANAMLELFDALKSAGENDNLENVWVGKVKELLKRKNVTPSPQTPPPTL